MNPKANKKFAEISQDHIDHLRAQEDTILRAVVLDNISSYYTTLTMGKIDGEACRATTEGHGLE